MSTQRKPDYVDEVRDEQSVHDYLLGNPEFFERHPALLRALRLPHEPGGTVSLVERQIALLRQKDVQLERQLKELIKVARANDVLAAKLHKLTQQLLAAETFATTVAGVEAALRTGFGADQAVLVLFGDPEMPGVIGSGRFLCICERNDPGLKPFTTFLNGNGPRCGQIRDAQSQYLFREDATDIGSAALVPLGPKASIGFLAIGSNDGARFHPGMSIDFLTRLGELVAAALQRF